MTTIPDDEVTQVALDTAARVEQDPVAMILVAGRLLTAASRHRLIRGRGADGAVVNAIAALDWALQKVAG